MKARWTANLGGRLGVEFPKVCSAVTGSPVITGMRQGQGRWLCSHLSLGNPELKKQTKQVSWLLDLLDFRDLPMHCSFLRRGSGVQLGPPGLLPEPFLPGTSSASLCCPGRICGIPCHDFREFINDWGPGEARNPLPGEGWAGAGQSQALGRRKSYFLRKRGEKGGREWAWAEPNSFMQEGRGKKLPSQKG